MTRLIESTECHLALGDFHFVPGHPIPVPAEVAEQALTYPGVVDRTPLEPAEAPLTPDPAPEAPNPLED